MKCLQPVLAALFLSLLCSPASAQQVTTLTPQPFTASGDIAVDAQGHIFVANYGAFLNNANGSQVYKVTPAGEVSVFANGLAGASGNEFDAEGNLFQSNIAGNSVSRITPDGVVTTVATGADGISNPVGLAFDSMGNLYVANCGNNTIQRIRPNGNSRRFASGGGLSCPNGLTADEDDNLYAANFNDGQIVRIAPDGSTQLFARTPNGASKPAGGNGHITYGNDRLYVVSNATQQVFEIDVDTAEMTLIAGAGIKGRADGALLDAQFSLPNGIGLSPDGTRLYINDSEDTSSDNNIAPNVVRVVELPDIDVPFIINAGLNDAWFNPATAGQGFFIIVFEDIPLVFMAWFTYDTERPPQDVQAILGEPGHRWITAQGPFEGDTATLDVVISEGGVFDAAEPAPVNAFDGQIVLTFTDCETGTVAYDITSLGLQGEVPIRRIANDNVGLCES